jgi:oxygen-independent coproporphyrinogen-3 oxidase
MAKVIPIQNALQMSARRGFITNLEGSRRGFITNYPNVTQWGQLKDSPIQASQEPLNIYLHIPFCAQQCSYCYYRVITGASRSDMTRYVDVLRKEMKMASERYNLRDRPIKSIYFGGGTPTMLQEVHLQAISDGLREFFPNIDADTELTIEGEPVTMTKKKAAAFANLSIPLTRISMGVQSLDDDVIKHTQRKDKADRVIESIRYAQEVGAHVNIDLMSGLAGDTFETWKNSVDKALETGVESITVYKTEVYANSQYFRELRKDAIRLPDDEEELQYMDYALDAFEKANYKPWSVNTFTKNGDYPHIHSPRLWKGEDYLPLGTSAFGKIGDQLFQNTNDPEKYMEAIESGKFPIHRGHTLSYKDKMVRAALLGMKLMKMDLDTYENNFGFRLEKLCASTIEELVAEGFITLTDTAIISTRKGILHADYIGKQLGRALQNIG